MIRPKIAWSESGYPDQAIAPVSLTRKCSICETRPAQLRSRADAAVWLTVHPDHDIRQQDLLQERGKDIKHKRKSNKNETSRRSLPQRNLRSIEWLVMSKREDRREGDETNDKRDLTSYKYKRVDK